MEKRLREQIVAFEKGVAELVRQAGGFWDGVGGGGCKGAGLMREGDGR